MNSKYTVIEKSILHSLYTKHNVEVKTRSRDASREAWENLKAEFNRSSGVTTRRTVDQLKSKIQHMRYKEEIPAPSNRRSIRLLSRVSSTALRRSGDGGEPSDPRHLRQMPDRRAQRSNSQSPPPENDEQRKRMKLLELQIMSEQWKIQVLQNKDRVQMKKVEKLTKEINLLHQQ